jgi:propanol-preferring alcohol dehydrogenase
MKAMRLTRAHEPLKAAELPSRPLLPGEVRIAVSTCAVCRTDLHVVDGELPDPKLPITPGHEIVGHVVETGTDVKSVKPGDRVGVPWLGWTCGVCAFCLRGQENLCPNALFTGYTIDGGFATETIADARFVFALPAGYSDEHAAPLLCAGLIGWRSWKAAGPAKTLGIYGFGAAAHIVAQVARTQGQSVYAFVRRGDVKGEEFARKVGAVWAGPSDGPPPAPLDAAIIFAPVGTLVPLALEAVRPGGVVVCGGIHMSDIPSFPYAILWGERTLKSVANLTRKDAEEFLTFADRHPIEITTVRYALDDANTALSDLRDGRLTGAAVLVP